MAKLLDNAIDQYMTSAGVEVPELDDVYSFHEGTKSTPTNSFARNLRVDEYLRGRRGMLEASRNRRVFPGEESLPLPPPRHVTTPFNEVLRRRTSVRTFQPEPLALKDVSTVLSGLSVNREGTVPDHPDIPFRFRPYPSAGGLFPIETYLIALNVAGLERASYHYCPETHRLTKRRVLPSKEELETIICDRGEFLAHVPLLFVLTAVFERSLVKYDRLGYRFAVMEAGIVGQQLSLGASAADLASLHWGGSYDDPTNKLLGIDGVDETMLHSIWCGKPKNVCE